MPIRDSSRRPKHRKKTEDKLDLDELTRAPNLGGMLSFLSVPPEEARRRQHLREAIEAERAGGPVGLSTTVADSPSLRRGPETGDRPTVVGSSEDHFPSLPGEISVAVDSAIGGHNGPTVVDSPTVGNIPSVSLKPILISAKPANDGGNEDNKASHVAMQTTPVDMHDLDVPAFMRKDSRIEQ